MICSICRADLFLLLHFLPGKKGHCGKRDFSQMCAPQIFYFLKQRQSCSTLDIKVHDRLLLLALLVLPQRHLGRHTLHHPGHPAQEAGQGVLKNQEIMLFHFGTYFKIHLKARGLCWTATLDHKLSQTADNTTLH